MVLKSVIVVAVAASAACSVPSSARIRIVNNDAELQQAIRSAAHLDGVALAPGKYGDLKLVNLHPSVSFTIKAQDPRRPPEVRSLNIAASSNIVVEHLTVYHLRTVEPEYYKVAQITSSSNIELKNLYIHGSLNGNADDDFMGLYIRASHDVTVNSSKFEESSVALSIDRSENVNVMKSEFYHLGRDAIDICGSNGLRISGNLFHKFLLTAGGHPDAIQGWTSGQTEGIRNVEISDNLIIGDPDQRVQGIFIRDELNLWQKGVGHKNIAIEGNVVAYTLWHGMMLDHISELKLKNNTLLNGPGGPAIPGGPVFPWISVNGAASLSGNEAPRYIVDGKPAPAPAGNQVFGNRDMHRRIAESAANWLKRHPDFSQ